MHPQILAMGNEARNQNSNTLCDFQCPENKIRTRGPEKPCLPYRASYHLSQFGLSDSLEAKRFPLLESVLMLFLPPEWLPLALLWVASLDPLRSQHPLFSEAFPVNES